MLEHNSPLCSTLFSVRSSFEDSENASPFFGESPPFSQLSLVQMCKLCGAKAVALGRRRLWLSNLEPGGQGRSCQTRRWSSVSSATSVKGKEKTNHDVKPAKDGEDGGLTGLLKRCCQRI